MDTRLRKAVIIVAALNFAYFGVEFGVALSIGSVSLFADSVDFLEDTSINVLVAIALGWSVRNRARVGMLLAGVLLVPAVAAVWTAWLKILDPVPPHATSLSLTAVGALVVNLACALILVRYRSHSGSLTRAAFLSARNDSLANIAIIATAGLTVWLSSAWPDIIVGLAIAAINGEAAHEVWKAARAEHREAEA